LSWGREMLHPAIALEENSAIHGKGLVASELIRCGEIVWQQDDEGETVPCEVIAAWSDEEQAAFRLIGYQCDEHTFRVCAGIERYMNHSCDPNTWWEDSRTLVARRDIPPGEEVTYDYATSEVAIPFQMVCRCGSPCCRRVITNRDYLDPAWQAQYGPHLPAHVLRAIAAAREGQGR